MLIHCPIARRAKPIPRPKCTSAVGGLNVGRIPWQLWGGHATNNVDDCLHRPRALRAVDRVNWVYQLEGIHTILSGTNFARVIVEMLGAEQKPSLKELQIHGKKVRRRIAAEFTHENFWNRRMWFSKRAQLFSCTPCSEQRQMLRDATYEIKQDYSAFYCWFNMRFMIACVSEEERATIQAQEDDELFYFPFQTTWFGIPCKQPRLLHIHSDAKLTQPHHNLQVRGVPEKTLIFVGAQDLPVRAPAILLKSAFEPRGAPDHTYTVEYSFTDHWGWQSGEGHIGRMELFDAPRDIKDAQVFFRPRIPVVENDCLMYEAR